MIITIIGPTINRNDASPKSTPVAGRLRGRIVVRAAPEPRFRGGIVERAPPGFDISPGFLCAKSKLSKLFWQLSEI